MSLKASLGVESPLDFAKVKEMDEWAKTLLNPAERILMSQLNAQDGSNGCIEELIGNSLSRVAEKAASSSVNWQDELVAVFDHKTNESTYVLRKYAAEYSERI